MKPYKHITILATFLLIALQAVANMASPHIRVGTNPNEVYSSRDIDIISETINIKIFKVDSAFFNITYTIRSDRGGIQIPLIFDAVTENFNDFIVFVNGKEITTKTPDYEHNSPELEYWQDSLRNHFSIKDHYISVRDLKYLEVNLEEGENTINVRYSAQPDIYRGSPVKNFIFNYNLEPARSWRSFKDLTVNIDVAQSDFTATLVTDSDIKIDSTYTYHLDQLPDRNIQINTSPLINNKVQAAIDFGAGNLALVMCAIMVLAHILLVILYRRKNPEKKFSWVAIILSIIIPFLMCCSFFWATAIINDIIGEYASRNYGYMFLVFFLYPIILLIYFPLIWGIDRWLREKLTTGKNIIKQQLLAFCCFFVIPFFMYIIAAIFEDSDNALIILIPIYLVLGLIDFFLIRLYSKISESKRKNTTVFIAYSVYFAVFILIIIASLS